VRNCYFEDETYVLKYFQNYTQSNCMMECALENARYNSSNEFPCLPWYLPTPSDSITICDPWEATSFLQNFVVDAEFCSYCLPDCSRTMYSHTTSMIPLMSCDYTNMGVSFFCSFFPLIRPQPTLIADQLKKEYSSKGRIPDYITKLESGRRTFAKVLPRGDIFTQNDKTYNAYDRDIALVELYFEKSTIIQVIKFAYHFLWTKCVYQIF
jgi:hypothetical protein